MPSAINHRKCSSLFWMKTRLQQQNQRQKNAPIAHGNHNCAKRWILLQRRPRECVFVCTVHPTTYPFAGIAIWAKIIKGSPLSANRTHIRFPSKVLVMYRHRRLLEIRRCEYFATKWSISSVPRGKMRSSAQEQTTTVWHSVFAFTVGRCVVQRSAATFCPSRQPISTDLYLRLFPPNAAGRNWNVIEKCRLQNRIDCGRPCDHYQSVSIFACNIFPHMTIPLDAHLINTKVEAIFILPINGESSMHNGTWSKTNRGQVSRCILCFESICSQP